MALALGGHICPRRGLFRFWRPGRSGSAGVLAPALAKDELGAAGGLEVEGADERRDRDRLILGERWIAREFEEAIDVALLEHRAVVAHGATDEAKERDAVLARGVEAGLDERPL